jgi:hypothetical protein
MPEDAPVARPEGAVARPRGGERLLNQRGSEPPVPAAGGAGVALARALMVPRAEARPARQVPGTREGRHVHSQLGDQDFRHALVHPRDRVQAVDRLGERGDQRLDLFLRATMVSSR